MHLHDINCSAAKAKAAAIPWLSPSHASMVLGLAKAKKMAKAKEMTAATADKASRCIWTAHGHNLLLACLPD